MRSKKDPLNRLLGYGEEMASYLRRRRLKRSPRVLLRWQDGRVKSLDLESDQGQNMLEIADMLIEISQESLKKKTRSPHE